MKKSKLDIPHIKEQVVKGMASGASQTDLSRQLGFDQSTISKFTNREDIRALIEEEQVKLLECVPDAVENVKSLVREMKNIPEKDIKRKELSYKASKAVLKAIGLLPSPVQSQIFVNLYQDNSTLISPVVMNALTQNQADSCALPNDVTVEDKE